MELWASQKSSFSIFLVLKGLKTMKFGQLIECNMRNSFFEKLYAKYGGEVCPRHLYKKSKLSISPNQQPQMLQTLYLLYVQIAFYDYIEINVLICFYFFKAF